jgi:hypothetical protein
MTCYARSSEPSRKFQQGMLILLNQTNGTLLVVTSGVLLTMTR